MNFTEQNNESTFVRNFITGPVVVDNILINPTLKELHEWGGKKKNSKEDNSEDYVLSYLKNEPNYIGTNDDGSKYVDIICWAKSVTDPNIFLNWNIRLTGKNIISSTSNKVCFINDKGSTSWAESIEQLPDWFRTPGVRKAIQGEEEFYSFLSAFNNIVFRKDDNTLSVMESEESLKNLFSGKFGELKAANGYKTNKLKLIVGLREKGGKFYHQIYNKQFFKHWDTKPYLYESVEKKGGADWPYFIDYLTNISVNSRYNPVIITGEETIWSLEDVKAKYDKTVIKAPEDYGIKSFDSVPPATTTNVDELPF